MDKSIGMDEKTFNKISSIAKKNHRTKIDQLRFWVSMEVKK